ncbi:hypothetical protein EON65_21885 [archaeon]|nr:MAG: hypothetical protein EON65_21885 [archaeon]
MLVRKGDLFSSKGILTIPSLPASVSSLAFIAFPLLGILSGKLFLYYNASPWVYHIPLCM